MRFSLERIVADVDSFLSALFLLNFDNLISLWNDGNWLYQTIIEPWCLQYNNSSCYNEFQLVD